MRFSAPLALMPLIIEAWFRASEKMMQPGSSRASVLRVVSLGDIAGGEEQGRLLAMQLRELALQQHVIVVGAGDVTRSAGARAAAVEGLSCIAASTAGCWPMPR